jgi:putative membrane protein
MKIPGALLIVMALATASWAGQQKASASDSAFAVKMAQVGIAEVELGKLATQKAMREDVKKFGQQMVDDHSKANDELKAVATKKNITLPSDTDAEHKALYDRLSKLSGAAFDQAYLKAMVDGHRKVAADVRKEQKSGSDAELKEFAGKTLPTVEAHLKHAEGLSKGAHSTSTN